MSQLKAIVDKLLTGVSSAYIPKGYISEMVLPEVQSAQQSGKLAKYGKSHLRIETSLKGGRGKYRFVEPITRSTDSYAIEGHGLEGIVSKEDYKNVELPYKAEEDETLGLSTMLWLEKEKGLADTLTSTSVITQNVTLAGASQFSDYNNSEPIDKFKTARGTIVDAVGVPANGAIMDYSVYNVLRYHPQMLDALGFKYAKPGGLSVDDLAVAMGVEKIFLAMARYNSAEEGQTDVLSACWGKHIVFGVFPEKAQVYQTSVGYMVRYEGEQPRKVYKQDNFNPPGSTSILVEDNYDMLISNAAAAYLIKDAVA